MIEIRPFHGDRDGLRHLFALAEDSVVQLDGYLGLGEVIVAVDGDAAIGHLQLVAGRSEDELEIKNMGVVEARRGQGIGAALVARAVETAADVGASRLRVSTASADTGNLRFYQRQGFRMASITPDAFVPETGYPEPLFVDGIRIRDQVWLERELLPRDR